MTSMPRSTTLRSTTTLGLTLALAAGSARASDGPATTVKLEPTMLEADEVILPALRYADVAAGFPVKHGTADRFTVSIEGDVLRADLDGDGTFDARIEGDAATATLVGTSPKVIRCATPRAWRASKAVRGSTRAPAR